MWFSNKYKLACTLSVIMVTYEIFIRCEYMMFLEVVDYNKSPQISWKPEDSPEQDICPPPPNAIKPTHTLEFPVFYWTKIQFLAVVDISNYYVPIFSTIFAGIYSDQFGGSKAVLLGLVLSGCVSSVLYFVDLGNDYIFLIMCFIRKIGSGIMTAAVWSIAGKWSKHSGRTVFVCILFIGQSLGECIGNMLIRVSVSWRTATYIASFICFMNALWWWFIFRYRVVPGTRKCIYIPWKELGMSLSLYIATFLILSCSIIESIAQQQLVMYVKEILWLSLYKHWITDVMLVLTKIVAHLLCGSASEYIILNGLLSPSALRRTIPCVLFLFVYGALLVIKLGGCDIQVVLACCVVLQFVCATFQTTMYTATLDTWPTYSGVVFGFVIWFSQFATFKMRYWIVEDFGLQPDVGTLSGWNKLFLISALFGTVFSLPFIARGVNKIPEYSVPRRSGQSGELKSNGAASEATFVGGPGRSNQR